MSFFFPQDPIIDQHAITHGTVLETLQKRMIDAPSLRTLLWDCASSSLTTQFPLPEYATIEQKRIYMARILACIYNYNENNLHVADCEASVEVDRCWATRYQERKYPKIRIESYENLLLRLIGTPTENQKQLRMSQSDTYRWGSIIRYYVYVFLNRRDIHRRFCCHFPIEAQVDLFRENYVALMEKFSRSVDVSCKPGDAFSQQVRTYLMGPSNPIQCTALDKLTFDDLKCTCYNLINIVGQIALIDHFSRDTRPMTHENLLAKVRAHLFAILDRVLESEFRRAFGETIPLTETSHGS